MPNMIIKNGVRVNSSRNLRGLIAYGHKHGVKSVVITLRGRAAANADVMFLDGAECRTQFADHTVARDFFKSRQEKWGGTIKIVPNVEINTAHGIEAAA